MTPDDFFDSDWEETGGTQETAVTRPSGGAPDPEAGPPPRRPRAEPRAEHTPRRRPSIGQLKTGNLPPLQYRRLGALAVGILAVVVVLVLLARGCSGSSSQSKNVDYFNTLKEQALTPSSDISPRLPQDAQLGVGHQAEGGAAAVPISGRRDEQGC